jgi:hypothetical protein
MQTLCHSTKDYEILYFDRCSEDEQLLVRQFLRKTKNTNIVGGWYLKLTVCFMATTHEPLYFDKRRFLQWKIVDIPTSFILILIFFNEPLEYGDGWIF